MEESSHPEEADSAFSPTPDTEKDLEAARLSKTKSLPEEVSLPREILVVVLISLAQLTTQIGLGQVLSILHIIGDHFDIQDPGILSWLIAGYSLTVGTFILFSGRLGDLFGWRNMLVAGYAWFAVWNIVAGLSWYSNSVLFIFARVLGGIGPAMSMPNGLALLGALYKPGKRKNYAFGFFGGLAPAGSVLGSLSGAAFALAWWPWAFWSFGITLGIVAVTAAITIPDPQDDKPGVRGKSLIGAVQELDLLGATVGITSLVLFNFAWNQAPIAGWASPYIIVTLVLGTLLAPAFFYIERRIAQNPLLPFEVFTVDNAFVLACVACGWANFGIWVYYLWQLLEVLRGTPPLLATAYVAPVVVAGMIAAMVVGYLLQRLRPAWVMIIAMTAFLTGSILIATAPVHQNYWLQIFFATIIAPCGMDTSFPSATLVISNSMAKEHQGVAASLVSTIVNYSISLGLGFAATVEINVKKAPGPAGVLHGYRSALYVAIGLDVLGLALAVVFMLRSYWVDHQQKQGDTEKKSLERADEL